MVALVFSSGVNTFLGFLAFGVLTLGFLALGFLTLVFALVFFLGFAFDLAFGNDFGVVFLGAGFLAAFVAEVVGAFFAAVVAGRDTTFCA